MWWYFFLPVSLYKSIYCWEGQTQPAVSMSWHIWDAWLIANTAGDTWRESARSLGSQGVRVTNTPNSGSSDAGLRRLRFLLVLSTSSLLQTTVGGPDVCWLVLAYLKSGVDGQYNLRLRTHGFVGRSQLQVKSHSQKRQLHCWPAPNPSHPEFLVNLDTHTITQISARRQPPEPHLRRALWPVLYVAGQPQ